jgi:P4 family phage/plasmid primase-like protien
MKSFDIHIPVGFSTDRIPTVLQQLPQWLHWVATKQKEDGRFNKIPVDTGGKAIDPHDPANWLTFTDVLERFNATRHSGIAIDLAGNAVRLEGEKAPAYLIGVDIDKCVIGAGAQGLPELSAHAQQVVDFCSSYTELSPSGTGVRIFFLSDTPVPGRNQAGMEIYSAKRFLTVTGAGWGDLRRLGAEELAEMQKLMFKNARNDSRRTGGERRGEETRNPEGSPHPQKPPENPETIAEMEQALRCIPPTVGRGNWMKVLMACKAHGFNCGETLCRAWSAAAGPYDAITNSCGYDEREFDNVWKYSPHSISHRTLYHLARQYGAGATAPAYGDTRNGRRFAKQHRGSLLFVYPRGKWLQWIGTRWAWCDDAVALQAAKEVAQILLNEATGELQLQPQSVEAKGAFAHAKSTFNLNRLHSMLVCAASEPGMHLGEISALDANPMLLGCKNGVVDLVLGELLNPQPQQLITKHVPFNFGDDETCLLWEAFLTQITLDDEDTIHYLQKMAGYFLTGKVNEELLHFLFGFGRNGKSVFANVLTRIMGDYVLSAPAEMLMRRDRGSSTNDIARLVGIRLLIANETRNGQAFDDLLLKTLVSTDRMSARYLYHEYFDFWPTHKILIRGNHKPLIADETEGAWRRVRLIPFDLKLDEQQADHGLEERLMQEAEGILAWAVRGCLMWQQEGLSASPRISRASACYRQECDLLGEFLETYVLDPQGQIAQGRLWEEWRLWSEENGVSAGSKKSFTRRLEGRGISSHGWRGSMRQYTGIRAKTSEEVLNRGQAA